MTIKTTDPLFGQPQTLINYNYDDLVFRTGYIAYYPFRCNNGSYAVGTSTLIGSELVEQSATADVSGPHTLHSRSYYLKVEQDIDLTFAVPVNLDGDMLFNIPIGVNNTTTSEKYFTMQLSAYHYDGSTETQIGSTTLAEEYSCDTDESPDGTYHALAAIKINTSGTIHFKAGEKLRVTIQVYGAESEGSTEYGFAADPLNRQADAQYANGDVTFKERTDMNESLPTTRMTWLLPHKTNVTIV